jgi:hypothetical protein
MGNAPAFGFSVFNDDDNVILYYLPVMKGWDEPFDVPTALWSLPLPVILTNDPDFGVQTNGFGFTISWPIHSSVVVEACTDLANSDWSPVATNTITDGSSYFSDPEWTNYPGRFYRVRSP